MLYHNALNCSGNHFGVGPKFLFETCMQCSLQWKNCNINYEFLMSDSNNKSRKFVIESVLLFFFLFDLTVRRNLGPSLHGIIWSEKAL